MTYLRPVNPTGICTWRTHTRRVPPSQEAGVDYYCPIGTPIRAAANGRVVSVAGGITTATGRFITIDLDDGRRVRYLHLSQWLVKTGDRVFRGQIIALSGASGYGSEFFGGSSLATVPANTGGPHVHTTLWPTHAYSFGTNAGTLDIELYTEQSAAAGDGAKPFPEEEDMTAEDIARIDGKLDDLIGAIGAGNGRTLPVQSSVLANVRASVTLGNAVVALLAPVQRIIDGQVASVSLRQEIADAKSGVLQLLGRPTGAVPDVDEAALAKALAPLLSQNVGRFTDDDLTRFAKAVADESDRRERERLGKG
jgi:murein DD-endopeptidase MepM/ murein hydrolase activator NlpD